MNIVVVVTVIDVAVVAVVVFAVILSVFCCLNVDVTVSLAVFACLHHVALTVVVSVNGIIHTWVSVTTKWT